MDYKGLYSVANNLGACVTVLENLDVQILYNENEYSICGSFKDRIYVKQVGHYSFELLQACLDYASTDIKDRKLTKDMFRYKYYLAGSQWDTKYYVNYADGKINLVQSFQKATTFKYNEFEKIIEEKGLNIRDYAKYHFILTEGE